MKTKFYCMGKNKDYVRLNANYDSVRSAILEASEGRQLEGGESRLVVHMGSDTFVPANSFDLYGPTIRLSVETSSNKPYCVRVSKFFKKVDEFAKEHGADSAVIHNFELNKRMGSNLVDGLAQLMLEK